MLSEIVFVFKVGKAFDLSSQPKGNENVPGICEIVQFGIETFTTFFVLVTAMERSVLLRRNWELRHCLQMNHSGNCSLFGK